MKLKKIVEYMTNTLADDCDDIVDVSPHDTLVEAMKEAYRLHYLGKRVNVEKMTRWWKNVGQGNEDIERQEEEDLFTLEPVRL